ncbi:hypothetical protein CDEST_13506 [Colletotrichum destructivum]|uniref:Uncharacterized protein n=1 Tax=Colletotrichum destructivum TaxID=34406 RepID=A0AAX4IZ06_9PEZI|nr:hypothetical protein CDEST_13506 [Colletotrichum destructivum]
MKPFHEATIASLLNVDARFPDIVLRSRLASISPRVFRVSCPCRRVACYPRHGHLRFYPLASVKPHSLSFIVVPTQISSQPSHKRLCGRSQVGNQWVGRCEVFRMS